MLMPVAFQHAVEGDVDGASATAAAAAEIGQRFGDRDLFALAIHTQGEFLVKGGRVREGLRLLDEAMVAVTEGGLSPVVTGIVYCGVILACEQVFELRRAREWTAALTRWCEQQPDLMAFTGHKLLGPTGIGALWARRALLEAMPPFLGGGEMIREVKLTGSQWNELPWKFEAGTMAIAEAVGFGAAIDYLESLGMEHVFAHDRALAAATMERLREVPDLTILGPPAAKRGGVVALLVDMPEHGLVRGQVGTVVERLDEGVFEVEFSDEEGRTYALEALGDHQLMVLRYRPEKVAS